MTKARDLKRGDVFRMHIYGSVVAVESVSDGKRIRVKIALENQGDRRQSGRPTG